MIIPRIKYFADRDYQGLNIIGMHKLKRRRSEYAKGLKKMRKIAQQKLNELDYTGKSGSGIEFNGKIAGGGVETKFNVYNRLGPNPKRNYHEFRTDVWDSALKSSEKARDIIKEELLDNKKYTKDALNNSELTKLLKADRAIRKGIKKAGKVGLGVAGAAGLAYGGKKLYDKYKKKDDNTKD